MIDERQISPEEGNRYLANADAWDIGTAKSFNALTREVAGIPRTWIADETEGPGGVYYRNPANPDYDNIRIMPGNPQSPFPDQQNPYVIDQKSGNYLTKDGTRVQGINSRGTHIPLDQYKFDKR